MNAQKGTNQSSSAASGFNQTPIWGRFVFVRRCLRTKMPLCGLAKCREIRGQPVTWEESRPTIRSSSKNCLKRTNGPVDWGFGRRRGVGALRQ